MELGNIIFGNSRGEKAVPRNSSFEGPWNELCEELKISGYGYPEDGCILPTNETGYIDTPVFSVRPYDWDAECDCGADDKMEKWFEAHLHSESCYQSAMNRLMAEWDQKTRYAQIDKVAFDGDDSIFRGMNMDSEDIVIDGQVVGHSMMMTPRKDGAIETWRTANDLRQQYESEQRKHLCAERGLSYPSGCAVHCDCGRNERADRFWTEIGGHTDVCRFMQPNFLYKPNGFRINWYKYPFRDSYMTPGISAKEWRSIIRHCIDSAARE